MRRSHRRDRVVSIGNRNFVTRGLTSHLFSDVYYRTMTMSWPAFVLATALVFLAFNLVFAGLYSVFPGSVANVPPGRPWHVIYFSFETLATVGYGDMHPQTEWGHWVASVETFAGLTFSAVLTGLIFARFSLPRARLLFSKNMVLGQHEGAPHLMARVANARVNMINDAAARLWLLVTVTTAEGRELRRFRELKLVRHENPSFMLSWTIFHRIDATSPLFGWGATEMEAAEASFILNISGTDDSVAQDLHARNTYSWTDVIIGGQFADILDNDDEGRIVLDYERFHDVELEVELEGD
jgi:inward rectifier potassium channel